MSASRIKTLILLILALTAAFLAAAVIPARTAQAREQREMLQSLSALFDAQGISLELETLPQSETLYTVELSGEPLTAVQALLGSDAALSPDSTRYERLYSAASGSAALSLSGAFTAELTDEAAVRDPVSHTEKLLQSMQLRSGPLRTQTAPDGAELCTASMQLLGVPVFGAELTFRYEDGALRTVSGVCFPGSEALSRVSESACISCADALTAFLRSKDALGWLGSRILGASQGYGYTESASSVRLMPFWRIETDTGVYRVSGISGEIRREDGVS